MVTDSVGTRGPISSNSSLPFSYLCLNPSPECSSSIFRRDPFFALLRCAPKEIAASLCSERNRCFHAEGIMQTGGERRRESESIERAGDIAVVKEFKL